MKFRETLKLIEHKGPNQTVILVDPSDCEIFEATQQISHHILIQAEHPCDELMYGRGWMAVQTTCLPKNIWHYVPQRLRPESWEDFWGVYDYPEHIEALIDRLEDDSVVVDVGTYHGKCAAHMAHCAKQQSKNIRIYTIEPYGWTPQHKPHPHLSWQETTTMFQDSGYNITAIKGSSIQCVKMFADESINHLHLDGLQGPNMLQELKAWLPKIRHSGTISGLAAHLIKDTLEELYDHLIIKDELDIWVVFKRHLKNDQAAQISQQ